MRHRTERGVALITALLVVTLATLIAVALTTRQQLDIRRTANILNNDQAYRYALGGESWASRILTRDDPHSDHLKELWAIPLPPTFISGGSLHGHLEDLQGRFNLNNLIKEGQVSDKDLARLIRLLTLLELSPALAQVIIDWIDADTNPQIPDGAEDNAYLGKTPAYRTANQPLRSPSELRLLAGFTEASYQKLLPYITVLPTYTLINVNTAPATVLQILATGLTEQDAQTLIAARTEQPFATTQDFLVQDALAGLPVDAEALSVNSAYFLFTAQVEIDRAIVHLTSILHRTSARILVVMRSRGTW
ncbi:MAG: hypothetical protein BWK79_17235 [Beggiatoa sp. IS2]|nr:MAG: hypothetical protein BWK79_17235 [Beggiatoa sp. IS2]